MKPSQEWLAQRISAIAALILILPLVACFIYLISDNTILSLIQIIMNALQSPFIAIISIILIAMTLYHGAIGIKIILEDYVHNIWIRKICVSSLFLSIYAVIALSTITILRINLSQIDKLHTLEQRIDKLEKIIDAR